VGDGADGDEIDAGFGDGADGIEADAAGGLGEGTAGDQLHSGAELVGRHVVEEDDIGAGLSGEASLVKGVGLDFDAKGREEFSGATNGSSDGIGEFGGESREVIVLDEYHVPETDAMVLSATAGDGVLLEKAPAGCGLPGIEDACAGTVYGFDEAVGGGGDS